MKNLAAFTQFSINSPAYVSINETEDEQVSISVRSEGHQVPSEIILSKKDFAKLIFDATHPRLS
jgi:hypothetical protein